MGTLRKLKLQMKMDRDLRKILVRGARNEILIDVDGDREADVALIDTTGDGDIDTLAVDLTGDGEFNLYFTDTNHNKIPDMILYDEEGDGKLEMLALGKDVEDALLAAANGILTMLEAEEYAAAALDSALSELDRDVRAARKALKKKR